MTEYDFSEEGYRRHLETQARIARWTYATNSVPQVDPYAPPTPAMREEPLPFDSRRSGRRRSPPPPPLPIPNPHQRLERRRTAPLPTRYAPESSSRYVPESGLGYGIPPQQQINPMSTQAHQFYPVPVQPYYTSAAQPGPVPAYHVAPAPAPVPTPVQQARHPRSSSRTPPQQHAYAQPPPAPVRAPPLQPMPVRSNSYPNPAPVPAVSKPGQKGYVYLRPPTSPTSPGSPVYGAPSPQPMRSPTREVSLLKRVFGSGGRRTPRRAETY